MCVMCLTCITLEHKLLASRRSVSFTGVSQSLEHAVLMVAAYKYIWMADCHVWFSLLLLLPRVFSYSASIPFSFLILDSFLFLLVTVCTWARPHTCTFTPVCPCAAQLLSPCVFSPAGGEGEPWGWIQTLAFPTQPPLHLAFKLLLPFTYLKSWPPSSNVLCAA